jgi:anti-sigma B factor antagonist
MILETKEMNKLLVAKIIPQEANLNNAEQFKQEMLAIIDNGHRFIAVNFSDVSYIDSSFLGAMVSSLKHALSKGAEIYLTNLRKDIHSLLQMIRMDKVFKIYGNAEEISASFSN